LVAKCARLVANPIGLDVAALAATVAAFDIAVIASLGTLLDPITAFFTREAEDRAVENGSVLQLAFGVTPVPAFQVAVVTLFALVLVAVAATIDDHIPISIAVTAGTVSVTDNEISVTVSRPSTRWRIAGAVASTIAVNSRRVGASDHESDC
jgi:hypothetical protein